MFEFLKFWKWGKKNPMRVENAPKRGRSNISDFTGWTWDRTEAYLRNVPDSKAGTVDRSILVGKDDYVTYDRRRRCFMYYFGIDGSSTKWNPTEIYKTGNQWYIL